MTLQHLKELAEKATPGPWKYDCGNGQVETEEWRVLIAERVGNYKRRKDCEYMYSGKIKEVEKLLSHDNEIDMEYIAALSPEIILALLNAVEALKLITEYGDIHGAPSRHATKTLAALDAALEFSNGA
jgi:hypothetical protein